MANPVLTRALDAAAAGEDLGEGLAADVLAEIMRGGVSEAEVAGLLMALRVKGETEAEITGLARTMRAFARQVATGCPDLLDTAGSGGGRPTFNVSTTAALIAAGAGCRVAKHGNRSATGPCGSADLLETLGARIDLEPEAVGTCVREVGFGFMFAPAHHQATRHVVGVRRALGVRTIFNFLGPLTNPAAATRQVVGIADPAYLDRIAGALIGLGADRALVVCGEDGMDELSTGGATQVIELRDGELSRYRIEPGDAGLAVTPAGSFRSGSPGENSAVTRAILAGEAGPARDLAVLNAGAAIYTAGGADSIEAGVRAAERTIDSGAAAATLERFVARTRELAAEPAPA